MKQTFEQLN